jgi:hypothetical protein
VAGRSTRRLSHNQSSHSEHTRKAPEIMPAAEDLRQSMTAAPSEASRNPASFAPNRWFPFLAIVSRHTPRSLMYDFVAGLVLAAFLVPVGIGYATASGLPAAWLTARDTTTSLAIPRPTRSLGSCSSAGNLFCFLPTLKSSANAYWLRLQKQPPMHVGWSLQLSL